MIKAGSRILIKVKPVLSCYEEVRFSLAFCEEVLIHAEEYLSGERSRGKRLKKCQAGFNQGFATAEQIDRARDWAFQNGAELDKLPKYVLGNFEALRTESYRRTLTALLRRITK